MKRRTTLSLFIALSVLLALASFPSTMQGQTKLRMVGDTGPIKLGLNQVLRLEVWRPAEGTWVFRFRRTEYMQSSCGDGACKNTPVSQSTSPRIMAADGETVSIEFSNPGSTVRGVILSDSPNVRVKGVVFDTSTQRIDATWDATLE